MKFSLVTVFAEYDGYVDGVWTQGHHGTLETATLAARQTEYVNGNRIKIAVVEDIGCFPPDYSLRRGLKRLDI